MMQIVILSSKESSSCGYWKPWNDEGEGWDVIIGTHHILFKVSTHFAAEGIDLGAHVFRDISDGCRGTVGGDGGNTAGILLGAHQRLQAPYKVTPASPAS